jgi:hypothetical protein
MANINELLQGHVTLEVECIGRLYLTGPFRTQARLTSIFRWTPQSRPAGLLEVERVRERRVTDRRTIATDEKVAVPRVPDLL